MRPVTKKDAERLTADPTGFALMIETRDLEEAIAAFVSVLNNRKKH